eukprot:752324-Hanusia_phi.AAC.5
MSEGVGVVGVTHPKRLVLAKSLFQHHLPSPRLVPPAMDPAITKRTRNQDHELLCAQNSSETASLTSLKTSWRFSSSGRALRTSC